MIKNDLIVIPLVSPSLFKKIFEDKKIKYIVDVTEKKIIERLQKECIQLKINPNTVNEFFITLRGGANKYKKLKKLNNIKYR